LRIEKPAESKLPTATGWSLKL